MSGFQLAVFTLFTEKLLFRSSTFFLSSLSHCEWEKEGVDGDFTVTHIGIHGKVTCCFWLNIKGKLVGKWYHVRQELCESFKYFEISTTWNSRKQIILWGGQTLFSDMLWCAENWRTRVRATDTQVTREVRCPCRCVTATAQICDRCDGQPTKPSSTYPSGGEGNKYNTT